MPSFDQRALRNCLGTYVTGVTIVTTVGVGGTPVGITVNSFSSVSLAPPLVLWSQALAARSFPAFRDADRFVINILSEEQTEISKRFAKAGEDKFANLRIRKGLGGLPIIEDCTAFLECTKVATYPGGDHAVFVGQVENFEHTMRKPLAFGGGRYVMTLAHDVGVLTEPSAPAAAFTHLDGARLVTSALGGISLRLGTTVGAAVWGNRGATVISWEPSQNPVSNDLRIGLVVSPIYAASGLIFSAFLPREKVDVHIEQELASLRGSGMSNIPSVEEIDTMLAGIRAVGVSRSVPERFGSNVTAFGAPIFDRNGHVRFALTAVGRTDHVGTTEAGEFPQRLKQEAALLSEKLVAAQGRCSVDAPNRGET
jgi:flavin reductase (DIM6/NTAB) family NADH-FMN oxidoreductase RutF/DNA-binding IclR family transcriptional regulator